MQDRSKQNIKVIDISHHNTINDWKKVAADGVKAVYIKLTEGKSYADEDAYKNYLGAKNAGLRVGFYCYSHCTNDYRKEVDFFLSKLGKMKPDLPHCLDLEENKGQSKAKVNAFTLAWLGYIQKKTAITPILYTGYSFLSNFTSAVAVKYPLWVARYAGGSKRPIGFDNPGNSNLWNRWAMFQFTDEGRINGIRGNVDVNEMDLAFFKSIDAGVILTGDASPPSSYQKGDNGVGVKELQQKLIKLGYDLPKYKDDGSYGDETVSAVKAFQKTNGLLGDGIVGEKTLAKIDDLIKVLNKPKEEDLPKVTSLGDKYSFQVKTKVAAGVYKYSNLAEKQKVIAANTIFSVYGYTEGAKAWAVPGGFVMANQVESLPVTLTTGGLSKEMEAEFRTFLKGEGIDSELNVHAKGNPSAEITVSGLQLVKVRQFLDLKGWYYK
ncbi:GH25 family lysozyme [Priestia megaterium]|uniref:GH25 family lysozyme n=1 Tax=Priestia megaterium TaxID=1404 RepID=UPI000BF8CAE7|nr:GH25 family lysozyme [Priestia megaterium]PFJ03210.1 autolysin [Priestia megaterium]PGR11745.1 autolysin [Priestia megaterium]